MKAGRTLESISQQILAEGKAKKDYVADTGSLTMAIVEAGGEVARRDIALKFNVSGQDRVYTPTNLCFGQIADRVGIPAKYAERMRTEAPELLCNNVNHWFAKKPEKRMLRTLDNGTKVARAFLSERYRPFDNFDLFAAVVPKLQAAGCEIRSSEITETRFYIQASTPRIQAVIDQNVKIGTHNRIQRTVQAGVIIGNSEVGCGSIFVDPMMYDLVCTNGLVMERTLRRNHVGRKNEGVLGGDEATFELFTDATREQDDKAFWMKVSDVVTAALNEIKFNQNIDRLRDTQKNELCKDVTQIQGVVEATAKRFDFAEKEKANMLLHFAQGGDFSQYGLINAITRTAEDCESYDRAVELERLGGQVIEMKPQSWLNN